MAYTLDQERLLAQYQSKKITLLISQPKHFEDKDQKYQH